MEASDQTTENPLCPGTVPAQPRHRGTLPEAVREHAKTMPDKLAVEHGSVTVTYTELDQRSNELARTLVADGVRRGSVVAIHLGRSIEWVVAMLGTLKAGGVCMTLDPKSPTERIERAFEVARPAAVLTHESGAPSPVPGGCPVIEVDVRAPVDPGAEDPNLPLSQEDLAYAVHTSGSEGRAKIVLAQHSWLTLGAAGGAALNGTGPRDRGSWLGPAGAGIAINEVCGLLWVGASIHIAGQEVLTSPPALRRWLLDNRITQAFVITPVGEVLQSLEWPEDCVLQLMTLGGDRLNRWGPPGLPFEIAVSYGSLEAFQIANSLHPWERRCTPSTATAAQREAPPPVGRPLPGVGVHVLEDELEETPVGSIGQLWIDSDSLSLGYLGDPGLTADKFRPNPFGPPGSRLYRSGDAGRFREDGLLEHHGRIDDVVKVRGHRVELGEVEWVLGGHPDVAQVCVAVARGEDEQAQLVACLVAERDVTPGELRAYAAKRLQDFMVPVAYVLMDQLPMNTNHKVDRRALPPDDWPRWRSTRPYRQPRGGIETRLAALYAELLSMEQVGADDDFMELGGDSLLVARLRVSLEDRFGIRIGLREVMEAGPLAELADRVARLSEKGDTAGRLPPIVARKRT